MLTSCVCALEEHGRKTLDWPPNTLLLSQVWPRKWVSMSMCLSSCTHKADKASHLVLDLRAERVNFAKEPAKSLTQPWCGHRDLSRWFPLFSPRSNAPDSETVLLCKTDGQRWYLECLVSGTERQNYPVRGKVILENPHLVCWRKISADKCSLRAFYPNVGVSLVIQMWSHYREKGHRTMRGHFDVWVALGVKECVWGEGGHNFRCSIVQGKSWCGSWQVVGWNMNDVLHTSFNTVSVFICVLVWRWSPGLVLYCYNYNYQYHFYFQLLATVQLGTCGSGQEKITLSLSAPAHHHYLHCLKSLWTK